MYLASKYLPRIKMLMRGTSERLSCQIRQGGKEELAKWAKINVADHHINAMKVSGGKLRLKVPKYDGDTELTPISDCTDCGMEGRFANSPGCLYLKQGGQFSMPLPSPVHQGLPVSYTPLPHQHENNVLYIFKLIWAIQNSRQCIG